MNPRPDFCPGCGAQVYPEEASCPFCGRKLHTSFLMPFLVGLGGTAVALVSGGLVWWVMSAPPAEPEAGAPQSAAIAPAPQAEPAPQPQAPPAAPVAPGATSPPQAAGDLARSQQEAALPLPTVNGPITPPAADANARRAFAKSKQESFAQNGLDLTVTAGGEDATILTIKFNFPAKTAAELIVAGPFPKQCEQRGFRQVLFVDPSGITWIYDVATQQMTQK
ncbi:zinc ribbon domain-containing protein [Xanthobacter autotrophicus]|uniref:zinc ribbon domain-containing protein n=1 Tax=Xanthobacter TaxID=279 RepID=UPI0024ABCF60|nr:zinc ribbon domain-containing protein [Xanthobacter autotrophicus]MDI4664612.1 zinc ribbon domain-containing protein [Xanthobacter autotrophicus]